MATTSLELENVEVEFGSFRLSVPRLSFTGSVTGIGGPNGSGKSTLLRIMDGLLKPQRGEARIDGREVSVIKPLERARMISYLPQEIPSPFAFRAIDVVKLAGYSTEENEDRAVQCMERLEIENLAGRNFNSLSGGEKRLTMLAGIMYQNSDIILMDEPETYLDIKHRVILRRAIREFSVEGKKLVLVLHDIDALARLTDETILMKGGRVVYSGPTSATVNEKTLTDVFSVRFIRDSGPGSGRYVAEEQYR